VVEKMTKGGIALPDEVVDKNAVVAQVGQVMKVGDSAFSDEGQFPGRRAQYAVGDWVIFPPHAGHSVTVEEEGERVNYRLMNDDHVLAKVDDPADIRSTVL